jgi:hypothetical protein
MSVTLVSAATSQGLGCSEIANDLNCELGDLVKGASATVTVVVAVDSLAFGTITNSATVASQMTDPDLLDNQVFRQADVLGND